MRAFVYATSIALMGNAHAQWVPAGMPFEAPDNHVFCFTVDTATTTLYIGGQLRNEQEQCCVLQYSAGSWSQLGYFNNYAYAACMYHDTLVVGGAFTTVNGQSLPYIAYYDGTVWQPFGTFEGSVRELKVIGGELIAAGDFDQVDGASCIAVAKRVGQHWEQVGDIVNTSGGSSHIIRSIGEYQGNLVVGGTFELNNIRYAMRFDGSTWHQFADGIFGSNNDITAIQEYQGDLYIGGTIEISAGNAGHAIMRWDGQEFHSLGVGPQLINGSYQYPGWVSALVVHRGKLIAGGAFQFANNVPASLVAAWDGTEWCGVGGYTDGGVISLGVFQDTLWAGNGGGDGTFNGLDMNNVAKYIWPEYADTCSDGTIDVAELRMSKQIRVWPNPADDRLSMDWGSFEGDETGWALRNAQGQCVRRGVSRQTMMDVSELPPGLYLLSAKGSAPLKVLIE